jgi:hypothetical protein
MDELCIDKIEDIFTIFIELVLDFIFVGFEKRKIW